MYVISQKINWDNLNFQHYNYNIQIYICTRCTQPCVIISKLYVYIALTKTVHVAGVIAVTIMCESSTNKLWYLM